MQAISSLASELKPHLPWHQSRIICFALIKAHIGVGARTGLPHSLATTAANEHDLNQASNLLHGDEQFVFADAGYKGAESEKSSIQTLYSGI